MERIKLLDLDNAPEKSKETLEKFSKGRRIINIFKAMANSPATLKTFFGILNALEDKNLSDDIIERIAIQLAVTNGCEYCLAAHSYSASKILSSDEIMLAREGKSSDQKAQIALNFANLVMKNAGKVLDEEFENVKNAGFSDAEILEIITVVSLNFFTNAINNVSQTKVDFPTPKE